MLSSPQRYVAYEYNSGRLNNQLHSLAFAFRVSKEIGRVLYIPKVGRAQTDWVGLHPQQEIATWDMDKLSESFNFVMHADLESFPDSRLAAFVTKQPGKDLYKYSKVKKECLVGFPDPNPLYRDPVQAFKTVESCFVASIGGSNGILGKCLRCFECRRLDEVGAHAKTHTRLHEVAASL
jgi:hypothetical protein